MSRNLIVVLGLAMALAACSSANDDAAAAPSSSSLPPVTAIGGAATTTVTTSGVPATTVPSPALPDGSLPPAELEGIAEAFDPLVAPLGYRVTRAALIDRSTYAADPGGTHLAVYVAPVESIDFDRYAADFMPLLETFMPVVFDQWSGLESFDFCQEPHAWAGPGDPPSLTLFDVYRAGTEEVDWQTADVAGIVALAEARAAVTLWISADVRDTATWQGLITSGS